MTLEQTFGNIDIYLFDQLLRGNIAPGMRLLDAGCGSGRNLIYLLREGYDVSAVDASPDAIAFVQSLATHLAPHLPAQNLRREAIESLSFPNASFDVVLCNSVLHFARSTPHFDAMLAQLWRVLRPGGLLFCRLASTIGMSFERVPPRPRHRRPRPSRPRHRRPRPSRPRPSRPRHRRPRPSRPRHRRPRHRRSRPSRPRPSRPRPSRSHHRRPRYSSPRQPPPSAS